MARPTGADAAATRNRIVLAARQAFGEFGRRETSLRYIAKEAGVALATIVHHYPSKDDLYDACIEAMFADFDAFQPIYHRLVADTPLMELDVGERVAQLTRLGFRFFLAHRTQVKLLRRWQLDKDVLDAHRQDAELLPRIARYSGYIADLIGPRPTDLRLTVQTVVFSLIEYALADTHLLRGVVGVGGEATDADVYDRIEVHLTSVARALVQIPEG
jgi:AcrR family transcriptional regulator